MARRGLHRLWRMGAPLLCALCLRDTGKGRNPTTTSQPAPLEIGGGDSDRHLPPFGLAPQKVEIQPAREELHVPRNDQHDAFVPHPIEPMLDGGEIVLGLQFNDGT
jgi:hypothetical protein